MAASAQGAKADIDPRVQRYRQAACADQARPLSTPPGGLFTPKAFRILNRQFDIRRKGISALVREFHF
jgi:hypothetical protein